MTQQTPGDDTISVGSLRVEVIHLSEQPSADPNDQGKVRITVFQNAGGRNPSFVFNTADKQIVKQLEAFLQSFDPSISISDMVEFNLAWRVPSTTRRARPPRAAPPPPRPSAPATQEEGRTVNPVGDPAVIPFGTNVCPTHQGGTVR